MNPRISLIDYDADWVMTGGRNLHPRPHPGYLTREEVVSVIGNLGVDGIELYHGYWDDYSSSDLKRLMGNAGLEIVMYMFFIDLIHPANERHGMVDQVFSLLDRTAELGGKFAYLIPGIVKDGVSVEQQRSWLIDGLRVCTERAESLGVTILGENLDYPPIRPLMGRGSQVRSLCQELNSKAYRLIFDIAAPPFVEEDSLATLKTMAPCVGHVHVKNYRRVSAGEQANRILDSINGQRYTGTVLDAGVVSVPPILAELQRMNYSGYIGIEYQGEEDPREALKHNLDYLRPLLAAANRV
jgi:sugar phosphate isomerase/epimerase